jgi:hypothetical protein
VADSQIKTKSPSLFRSRSNSKSEQKEKKEKEKTKKEKEKTKKDKVINFTEPASPPTEKKSWLSFRRFSGSGDDKRKLKEVWGGLPIESAEG